MHVLSDVRSLRMPSIRSFTVFGEPVEILTDSRMTAGQSCMLVQSSPPGGGVPPHSHKSEDETFFVLEGEYELVVDGQSRKLSAGDTAHATRGSVHTFRNIGVGPGRMLVVVVPGGFETYLEEISHFSIPYEMLQVLQLSDRYGIQFAT